jgi:hypothetical protein
VYFQTVWKAASMRSNTGWSTLFSSTFSLNSWLERERVSSCYYTCFTVQTKILLELILNSAGDHHIHRDREVKHLSLRAPSFRSINPAARYDLVFELISVTPFPWLRNGLAGTPLFGLSSDNSSRTPWAGYHTTVGANVLAPPMFFVLGLSEPPQFTRPNRLYFGGEGHDNVGPFTLRGSCHIPTGTIEAVKTYPGVMMASLHWAGMVTPFGMVGIWCDTDYRGWWWVWPAEWSSDANAE